MVGIAFFASSSSRTKGIRVSDHLLFPSQASEVDLRFADEDAPLALPVVAIKSHNLV
jgi:hypothetical protein